VRGTKIGGGVAILLGLAFASVGTANLAGATGATQATAAKAPLGNNGTIKIDQTVLVDQGKVDHANHPHVDCSFALSFFGYDTGTQTAVVMFTAQPPSGTSVVVPTVGPSSFTFTGKGPGGSLDASKAYELDVAGLKADAQQGYHIKVEVEVSGSQGSDDKYKVFWYEPCTPVTTTTTVAPTTTVGPTTTTVGATTTTLPPTTSGTGPQVSTTTTTDATTTTAGNTTTTGAATTTTASGNTTTTASGNTTTTASGNTTTTASGNAPGNTTTTAPAGTGAVAGGSGGGAAAIGASVGGTAGAAPASSGQAAQVPAAALPTGAGTDLGSFNPTSWTSSSLQAGEMLIAGGLLLCGAGGFAIRRKGARATS
jgi:hypothetical protein